MNKHERRACAAFIRKHVYNVLTFRASATEEVVLTIKLPPIWKEGGAELSHHEFGDIKVELDKSGRSFEFPEPVSSAIGQIALPLRRGWIVSPLVTRLLRHRSRLILTQRFCVKTDTGMFPVADDIDTLYEFARRFRKFVGFNTVLVQRGPVLYAALLYSKKITFARQSGNQLIIDSENARSGQSMEELLAQLEKRNA